MKKLTKMDKAFDLKALQVENTELLHAREMEEAVIGQMLAFRECQPEIFRRMNYAMFYENDLRAIFDAAKQLYDEGNPIDILTVADRMHTLGTLEEAGGAFRVTELSGRVASSVHADYHIGVVADFYARRQARILLWNMAVKMQDFTLDISDIITETVEQCTRLLDVSFGTEAQLKDMPRMMEIVFHALHRRMEQPDGLTGLDMGIACLNEMFLGWQANCLYVIAARPGEGKTAFMLHSALTMARTGKHVLIISMEMAALQLGDRLIGMTTHIPTDAWQRGKLTPEQLAEAEQARAVLEKIHIEVHDNGSITMEEVCAIAKARHAKGECDVVCVDYLQLFRGVLDHGAMREQEVARNSRLAKGLAMQLDIPVLLLSQLNRLVEGQKEQRPQLSNLRESGAIEQDADVVMLLHRPAKAGITTDKKTGYPTEGLLINIIAKNRNGETGDLYLSHNTAMTRFADYEPPAEWVKRLTGGNERKLYDEFVERKKTQEGKLPF